MTGSHGDYFGEAPYINWTHGWPLKFAVRSSYYLVALGPGKPNPKVNSGPIAIYSRWPLDNAPVTVFHPHVLLADLLVLVSLVTGVWIGLGATPLFPIRFSIRSLLLLALVVGLVAARAVPLRVPVFEPRYGMQVVAYSVVLYGVLISLFCVGKVFQTRWLSARANPK